MIPGFRFDQIGLNAGGRTQQQAENDRCDASEVKANFHGENLRQISPRTTGLSVGWGRRRNRNFLSFTHQFL